MGEGFGPLRSELSGSSAAEVPGIPPEAKSAQIRHKMVTGMMTSVIAMPRAAGINQNPKPFIR